MGTLKASIGIYAEVESAIHALRQLCPTSPVNAWWDQEGRFMTFLISNEKIPVADRTVIADNISYVRNVLKDAVETRDVPDIEYVVTRIVSDIEDVVSHYNDWIYVEARSTVTNQETTFEINGTFQEHTLAEVSVLTDEFQWKYQLSSDEVFEFHGPKSGSSSGSAA